MTERPSRPCTLGRGMPLRPATALLPCLLAACAAPPEPPPNLVLIVADDLGWGDLGCYGGELETPHLDALAAGGLRFTDHHSAGAVCSPTRASLLTGRYPQRAGLAGVVYADPDRPERGHGLAAEERTLAEALREAGYATALVGKWHLGYRAAYSPTRHGFDRFRGFKSGNVDYRSHVDQAGAADWWWDEEPRPEEGFATRLLTRHAVEFVEQHRAGPFFLLLAHGAPHYPYQGPGDPALRAVKRPRPAAERDPTTAEKRARYATMVRELDASVGRLVDRLDELDLRERTLLVFLSDNGANAVGSNAPWRGTKGTLWEGGHRVPAIASWPGRIAPGVEPGTVHTNDWMPTLLRLAEAEVETVCDGVDLSPVLLQEAEAPRRAAVRSRGRPGGERGPRRPGARGHGPPPAGPGSLAVGRPAQRDDSARSRGSARSRRYMIWL